MALWKDAVEFLSAVKVEELLLNRKQTNSSRVFFRKLFCFYVHGPFTAKPAGGG